MGLCDIPGVNKIFNGCAVDAVQPEPQKHDPTLKDIVKAPMDCADGVLQPEKDYGAADGLVDALRPLVALGKVAEAVGTTLGGSDHQIQCKPSEFKPPGQ